MRSVHGHSSSRGAVERSLPVEIRYLETDQFALGGYHACSFAACYWALYLLFSNSPRESTLKYYLRRACEDWQTSRPTETMRQRLDHVGDVYKEVQQLRSVMSIQADYQGLMVTPQVHAKLRHLIVSAEGIGQGLRSFLQKMAHDVLQQPRGHALSFAFTRSNATLGGSLRLMPDSVAMRIDLVDSHQRNFDPHDRYESALKRFKELGGDRPVFDRDDPGCATWITCYTIDDAVKWLEAYYPPSGDAQELSNYLAQQSRGQLDRQKLPSCMFSLTVFEPNAQQMSGPSHSAY